MKYVQINGRYQGGGFVLVEDKPTGYQIKAAALHQNIIPGGASDWQLLGHNANGTSSVIGNNDVPWQHDFEMNTIYDNA